MPLTRYHFKNAVNAFFEMPRENAREILPPHLQPMELHHGQGVLAVTAFDFTQSMVGPYTELFLAVIVPPLVRSGQPMPKSAFYPFMVATSTAAARAHAIERWHLPHFMKDIAVVFEESGGRMSVRVRESGGGSILDFKISQHTWVEADDPYQSFMHTNEKRYKVDVQLKGRFTEHEEESGELTIYDHPMCDKLHVDEIATYPFREMWMKDGVQTFQELETI
jgi:hypothetical protein